MSNGHQLSGVPPSSSTNWKDGTGYPKQHHHTNDNSPHHCTPIKLLCNLSNHIDTRKTVDVFRNDATRKAVGYSGWMGHRGQPDRLKLNRQNCTVFRIFSYFCRKFFEGIAGQIMGKNPWFCSIIVPQNGKLLVISTDYIRGGEIID